MDSRPWWQRMDDYSGHFVPRAKLGDTQSYTPSVGNPTFGVVPPSESDDSERNAFASAPYRQQGGSANDFDVSSSSSSSKKRGRRRRIAFIICCILAVVAAVAIAVGVAVSQLTDSEDEASAEDSSVARMRGELAGQSFVEDMRNSSSDAFRRFEIEFCENMTALAAEDPNLDPTGCTVNSLQ
ncbi:hypothetical protein BaRGS_00026044 [Batillaria attramentaria]|uniref:Uncharacterized protein n=1 Tax=Batillaria attramentaria TaxID=370345 RepID=A0ABD0K7C3_9CAEN